MKTGNRGVVRTPLPVGIHKADCARRLPKLGNLLGGELVLTLLCRLLAYLLFRCAGRMLRLYLACLPLRDTFAHFHWLPCSVTFAARLSRTYLRSLPSQ